MATLAMSLLFKVIGGNTFDPNVLTKNERYIGVGVDILGEWLQRNNYGGFRARLNFGESALRMAAKAMISMPSDRSELFRQIGVNEEQAEPLNQVISQFSVVIRDVLEAGYTPKQAIAGLLISSTGQEPQADTSMTVRNTLDNLSGGKLPQVHAVLTKWVNNK